MGSPTVDLNVNPSSAPDDTAAPTSDPTITGQPAPSPAIQGTPAASPTTQQQPEPSWLRGRLQETREAAVRAAQTQWEQERRIMQAQFEAQQAQLHALVGVSPQEDPEVSAVRSQFQRLYPGLAQLEQRAKDVLGVVERSGDIDSQTKHYWSNYGRQTMDRLYDMAGKSLGSPIGDDAKRALHAAFSGYIASSPEATNRYMQDPALVEEFWSQFETNFIGPVRRTTNATVQSNVQNRNLPQDTPSGAPQVGVNPVKPVDLDERTAMAWASYSANRNQS